MAVSSVRLSVSGAMVLVTACASSPEAPPRFDVAASLESQIDTFVYADKATRKRMKSVNTLALTGCNVLFATRTRASASTGSGMFGEVGNTVRSEAKISQIYTLEGLTDADMQAMAASVPMPRPACCARATRSNPTPNSAAIPSRWRWPHRVARRR